MPSKALKRKISEHWQNQCACCHRIDYLEYHHIIPIAEGGKDDFDNIILLCGRCHAIVHGRSFDACRPNCKTSIDYESAKPILDRYFNEEIGTRETKELLHLSPKTHLSESALVKRYKREHHIEKFYNHVDLYNSIGKKTTNPDKTKLLSNNS